MRIGIDMLAVQSPHHGHRGIGRYCLNLVSSMLGRDDGHEYVLYVHRDLPAERIPEFPRATVKTIRPNWHLGETMTPFMDRLARTNPDNLDALVIGSPFEKWSLYCPPAHPKNGLKMASIVYDLIPFLFPDEITVDPVLVRQYRVLDELTRYDLLLAISEATRRDCLSLLDLPADKVVTIGTASSPEFFVPDRRRPVREATRLELEAIGIERPFLLNVGGLDPRKNTWTLIEAFGAMPEDVRARHQLVLTFSIGEWHRLHVLEEVAKLGLDGQVVVTGEVTDEMLRRLYQQCEAFVFPSSYEGFGLPILEAMHCGAPVIAGNNSSQIDVAGDAGLLVDVNDRNDIAAKMARVLDDPILAWGMSERGIAQASTFSWEKTADLALEALARPEAPKPSRRFRFDRGHSRKPTIAFFSPFPPRKSGISDYSALLIDELRKTYRIDLFHDTGYIPDTALASADFMACDHTLFDRMAAAKDYHAIVYQMGNSRYHYFMYDIMLRHPGVMTLHDFCLTGFHLHYGRHLGIGHDFLSRELAYWYPESAEALASGAIEMGNDWDGITREFITRGWHLNRHLLDASALTVVHSPWCARQVDETSPAYSDKTVVIPMGTHPRRTTDAQRAEIRARFNIPADALVLGSFGFVHPEKMQPQALQSFTAIARADEKAVYMFVGEEADGGEVRRNAEALGLQDRVRFLGRQPASAFDDLMLVTDIGVNLRMPPTNGETSAALLNLLASGVPTVVTDVATFSDFPASVVRRLKWESEGQAGLDEILYDLAARPAEREALGRSAWAYVDEHHDWPHVAELYVEVIERSHQQKSEMKAGRAMTPRARASASKSR